MATDLEHANVSAKVRAELQRQYPRVQEPYAAQRVWERFLSDADRQLAGGNLDVAYRDGRTIGFWSRLRGISQNRALVDLAEKLGFLGREDAVWLLRELGEQSGDPAAVSAPLPQDIPHWDRDTRQLWFRGGIVRRISNRNPADHIIRILDAFEEEGWPRRIYDPLPDGSDPVRLRAAIRSLNNGLNEIRFRAVDRSQNITWEPPGSDAI